jgi:hypothetical protein
VVLLVSRMSRERNYENYAKIHRVSDNAVLLLEAEVSVALRRMLLHNFG